MTTPNLSEGPPERIAEVLEQCATYIRAKEYDRENLVIERDAGLLRAEAAEAQVKALLEALPGERAEGIAEGLQNVDAWVDYSDVPALRAYAAAAKPKER